MSRSLTILYHYRVAALDGQSVHIQAIISALEAQGHTVIPVGPRHGIARTSQNAAQTGNGGLLAAVRARLPRWMAELLELAYALRAYGKLKTAVARHKPDLIYERYNLFLPAGAWLARKTGLPLVVEVNAPLSEERAAHGGLAWHRLARRIERFTWISADRVIAVSTVLADRVAAAGVARDRILVLHNGINTAPFDAARAQRKQIRDRLGLTDTDIVLGFVGYVRTWHGLDQIVRLIAAQRDIQLKLLVIGTGPALEACRTLADDLDVSDRLTCLGPQPHEDIPILTAAMDIALQPSATAYASPLKLFDYMGAAVAIVAPDQPNIREILTHGRDALLFTPPTDGLTDNGSLKDTGNTKDTGDMQDTGSDAAHAPCHHGTRPDTPALSMRDAVATLAGDPDLRRRLGQTARQTIDDRRFRWVDNAMRAIADLC